MIVPGKAAKILLVDSNVLFAKRLGGLDQPAGYRIVTAPAITSSLYGRDGWASPVELSSMRLTSAMPPQAPSEARLSSIRPCNQDDCSAFNAHLQNESRSR